jgi:hypothetical protein
MQEYFLIQTLYHALENLLKHEGEKEANGIGLECDSDALKSAREDANDSIEQAKKYFNLRASKAILQSLTANPQ